MVVGVATRRFRDLPTGAGRAVEPNDVLFRMGRAPLGYPEEPPVPYRDSTLVTRCRDHGDEGYVVRRFLNQTTEMR